MQPRWDQVLVSESEWIQCTKCGDKPRGQPTMYCTGCKKAHGNWKPNMMGLILQARQSYSEQRGLVENVMGQNNQVKQRISLAKRRTAELDAAKGKAAVARLDAFQKRETAETALARKNPSTAAIAKRQAAELFDDVERLFQQQVVVAREADDAEAEAAMAEAEATALEDSVRSSDADVAALRREVDRLKSVLVDAVVRRGGGGGGAAGAFAPAPMMHSPISPSSPPRPANVTTSDVWAHIQRAQANRQQQLQQQQQQAPYYAAPAPAHASPYGQPQAPYGQPQSPVAQHAGAAQPIHINIGGAAPLPPGAYFVPSGGAPPVPPPGYAAVPVYAPQAASY